MLQETVTIGDGGRIVIPSAFRKSIGANKGDKLTIKLDKNGEMRLCTIRSALKKAQKAIRDFEKKKNVSFSVDDFLAWRKIDSRDKW